MRADLTSSVSIEQVEQHMLELPQVECPVVHHFGPGIYVREVTLKAGAIVVGHHQKHEHLNIVLTGRVALIGDDGLIKIIDAPLIFVGKPGRKMGCIISDCVWHNIYATDERDVEKLEAMLFEKSAPWKAHQERMFVQLTDERAVDRESYEAMAASTGLTAEEIKVQVESETDQICMPEGMGPKVTVRPSPIHGQGIFLSAPADAGEVIAPASIAGMRTPAGRFTNHAAVPNAVMVARSNGDIDLVATRSIRGCAGGDQGEEVTIDYVEARITALQVGFAEFLATEKQAPLGEAA